MPPPATTAPRPPARLPRHPILSIFRPSSLPRVKPAEKLFRPRSQPRSVVLIARFTSEFGQRRIDMNHRTELAETDAPMHRDYELVQQITGMRRHDRDAENFIRAFAS